MSIAAYLSNLLNSSGLIAGSKIASNTIELSNLSATGTPSASNFLRGDNTWASPTAVTVVTLGTTTATTSGTTINFTGIPATAKVIYVTFTGVATNGASPLLLQLGTSGGVQATGYLGTGSVVRNTVLSSNYTTGFGVKRDTANQDSNGVLVLTLLDSSNGTWACGGVTAMSTDFITQPTAGSKVLSGTLDRIRLTSVSGDTFNAGKMNIAYS